MKTVQVRIAVAVNSYGAWNAYGRECSDDDETMACVIEGHSGSISQFWITAELPVPEVVEAAGTVTPGV